MNHPRSDAVVHSFLNYFGSSLLSFFLNRRNSDTTNQNHAQVGSKNSHLQRQHAPEHHQIREFVKQREGKS